MARPANPLDSQGVAGAKTPDLVPEKKVANGVDYNSKPDAAPDARVPDTAAGNRGPGGSVDSPQGSASGGFQPASTGTKRVSPATTANIDMPAPTMGGACFLAGTVVETQDGLRAIETVEVGQWVAGRNEASGKTTWRRVVQTFRTEDMQALAVDVRHADGEVETIQTTTEHPFYVQDKSWCEARELSAGDRLVLIDNTLSTVVAVEPIAGLHVVYNFEVEVDHTYFVGGRGIWVHNTCRIDWANVRRADRNNDIDSANQAAAPQGANNTIPKSGSEFTPIRFGENGELYAKLPAPSNPEVMRWQRMNNDGLANRDAYMGSTPSKNSSIGLQVQDQMRQKGALVGDGPNRQVLGSDGNWYSINQTDMGHVTAAVDYWNAAGRYYGPRSPEVRNFMKDPKNYWLEPSRINRSNGASMGKTYM